MPSGSRSSGVGLCYPDADSPGELWENVPAGRRAFRRLPDERMNSREHQDGWAVLAAGGAKIATWATMVHDRPAPFAVSVLAGDQQEVARHFADSRRPGPVRRHRVGARPACRYPAGRRCPAWLECELVKVYGGATTRSSSARCSKPLAAWLMAGSAGASWGATSSPKWNASGRGEAARTTTSGRTGWPPDEFRPGRALAAAQAAARPAARGDRRGKTEGGRAEFGIPLPFYRQSSDTLWWASIFRSAELINR